MGSSEITFICGDKRVILTVTYKGGGGGSILFHQASWDPVFLADIDPEEKLDLPDLLSAKVCRKADLRIDLLILLPMHARLRASHNLSCMNFAQQSLHFQREAVLLCSYLESLGGQACQSCRASSQLHEIHEATASAQTPGPPLPAELGDWPIKEGAKGKAVTLRYLQQGQCWERLPESDVSYSHSDASGQVRAPYPQLCHMKFSCRCNRQRPSSSCCWQKEVCPF